MKVNNQKNKGEWAEFYAFLTVLADRKLFAADENLEPTEQVFIFQKVIRQDEKNLPVKIYDLTDKLSVIPIINHSNNEVLSVFDTNQIKEKTKLIFSKIQESDKTFEIPEAEQLMKDLLCTRVKASNEEKADLVAVIHDRVSDSFPMLGFSVKSMVGGAATLLNAGKTTNFVYEVTAFKGDVEIVNNIKTNSKIRERIALIKECGGVFKFSQVADPQFESNQQMVDSLLPVFLAEMLLDFFTSERRTIVDLVDEMTKKSNLTNVRNQNNYGYKIRNFLDAVALGMVPSKPWDGFMKAHGGYIVVKDDGEVLCYHLYNRDVFQMYLYNNTRLEAPSSTRHDYGKLYEKDGKLYFNLNLQIRFNK